MLLLAVVPAVLVGMLAGAPAALAAPTYTVNDPADTIVGKDCSTPGTTTCTLRLAIANANLLANAGATINVNPGLNIVLTSNTSLNIANPMTIAVSGAGTAAVDGNSTTLVFQVTSGPVTISGLTIRHGTGGGISSAANLTLNNVSVTGCLSTAGGGVLAAAGALTINGGSIVSNLGLGGGGLAVNQGATSTINGTTISNNVALAGGGLYVGGSVTMNGGTVTNNSTQIGGLGGGAYVISGTPAGILAATGTVFSGNSAGLAGGILDSGSVTLTGASVFGNTATGSGGGLFVGDPFSNATGSTATVTGSTIRGNTAAAGSGGGIYLSGGQLNLTGSTLNANVAGGSSGGGGGIYSISTVSVVLSNDTLSGNQASGSSAAGGGILQDIVTIVIGSPPLSAETRAQLAKLQSALREADAGGKSRASTAPAKKPAPPGLLPGVNLDFVTLAGNSAAGGGGIANPSGLPFEVHDSIVATNTAPNGPDCGAGPFTSAGYNLESGSECAFAVAGDKRNANPLLDALAANGGPTQTRALLGGSPAIDSADPASTLSMDQRGVRRPQGPHSDIGAFEVVPPVLPVPAPPSTGDGATAAKS